MKTDMTGVVNDLRSLVKSNMNPTASTKQSNSPFAKIISQELNKSTTSSPSTSFSNMVSQQVGKINDMQNQAHSLENKYVMGSPEVSLSEVMVAQQKAGLTMNLLTETNSKLIAAYKDVINMQV